MIIEIEIDVAGETRTLRELLAIRRRLARLKPAMRAIAVLYRQARKKAFDTEGASGKTGKWIERKEDRIAGLISRRKRSRKARRRRRRLPQGSTDLLRGETLDLMDSYTRKNHPDHVVDLTNNSVTVGSKVPYAKYHQRGTRHTPARPPEDIRAVEIDAYRDLVVSHVLGGRPGLMAAKQRARQGVFL
jgi:phage gpG-like protein